MAALVLFCAHTLGRKLVVHCLASGARNLRVCAPIHHHVRAFELRAHFNSFVGLALAHNTVLLFVEYAGIDPRFVFTLLFLS